VKSCDCCHRRVSGMNLATWRASLSPSVRSIISMRRKQQGQHQRQLKIDRASACAIHGSFMWWSLQAKKAKQVCSHEIGSHCYRFIRVYVSCLFRSGSDGISVGIRLSGVQNLLPCVSCTDLILSVSSVGRRSDTRQVTA
jgi:hypothetical protein